MKLIIVLLFLLLCTYFDVREKRIPCYLFFAFGIIGILFLLLLREKEVLPALQGVIVGIGVLFLARVTREGIGYGDGIILLITGLYLGLRQNVLLFLLAILLSSAFALVFWVVKRVDRKTELPFVPFLAAAFLIQLCWF